MFWIFMLLIGLILWTITPEIIRDAILLIIFVLVTIWLIRHAIKFFRIFGLFDGIKIIIKVLFLIAAVLLVLMLPVILIRIFLL